MNNVTTIKALSISKGVRCKDVSDSYTRRLRILFPNGLGISIIQGEFTYGGDQGLYEIAPLNKADELDGSILELDDDVEGHLTEQDVLERCEKIASM